MKYTTVINIITYFFILLFTYAAVSKILDYQDFKVQLESFPYLSFATGYVPWMIPATELVIVLLLFSMNYRLSGLLSSLILLIVFTLYLSVIIIFSPHVPCSCGGILKQLSWKAHIVFNMVCICLSILAITLKRKVINNFTEHKIIVATSRGSQKPVEESRRYFKH